jgi:hypothetical protein
MADPDRTDNSTTMADVNRPTPQTGGDGKDGQGAPRDRRTVAPTPDADHGGDAGGNDASILDAARDRVASGARNARNTAAETAEARADRIREAGEAFEEDSHVREAADRFADQIGDAARTIREADLGSIADDLTAFARRQPLVFFGGAALLGFAAARALKASERDGMPSGGHDRGDAAPAGRETYGSDPWGADPWTSR